MIVLDFSAPYNNLEIAVAAALEPAPVAALLIGVGAIDEDRAVIGTFRIVDIAPAARIPDREAGGGPDF